jgi:hypothetical protein
MHPQPISNPTRCIVGLDFASCFLAPLCERAGSQETEKGCRGRHSVSQVIDASELCAGSVFASQIDGYTCLCSNRFDALTHTYDFCNMEVSEKIWNVYTAGGFCCSLSAYFDSFVPGLLCVFSLHVLCYFSIPFYYKTATNHTLCHRDSVYSYMLFHNLLSVTYHSAFFLQLYLKNAYWCTNYLQNVLLNLICYIWGKRFFNRQTAAFLAQMLPISEFTFLYDTNICPSLFPLLPYNGPKYWFLAACCAGNFHIYLVFKGIQVDVMLLYWRSPT